MPSRPELTLDWCSYAAAKYAVEHWHYSRCLPRPKNVYLGVWEGPQFIGVLVFTLGAGGATNGQRYGLARTHEVAERGRVALRHHDAPVSRIISIGLRLFRKQSPGIQALVSFADPYHGHVGAIYQAMNWLYVGQTSPSKGYLDHRGNLHHERVVSPTGWKKQYGIYKRCLMPTEATAIVSLPGKHSYLYPLTNTVRQRVAGLTKPYPKRPKDSSEPPAIHAGEGGAAPTRALQS